MIKQKYYFIFFLWFLLSSIFIQLLNVGMLATHVHPGYGIQLDFDQIVMSQAAYFTIWTNVLTACWAAVNLMYLTSKNFKDRVLYKPIFTMITSFNVALILVFFGTFVILPSMIVDFDTWWQILKSMVEHLITPILLLIFYFLTKTSKIPTKQYALHNSWWMMLMPAIYLCFAATRAFLMHRMYPDSPLRFFAYPKLDPNDLPVYVSTILVILVLGSAMGLGILMNFLSNLVLTKFEQQKPQKGTKKKSQPKNKPLQKKLN